MKIDIYNFQKDLKIKFKSKSLLLRALTHKSANLEYNNEKLEFLGDRVLGLVVSKKLYELFPNEKVGSLDKKLASLVNKNKCLEIGNSLNLKEFVITKKKPLLGICVGLQMFADIGYEETETKGLGWIPGKVSKIDNQNRKYKLPHIGWNQINIVKESKIFKNIENNSHMYFVHSYEFIPEDKNVISATTDYSSNIVCSVEKENIFGTQFHPEKSDKLGLQIIKNFLNL